MTLSMNPHYYVSGMSTHGHTSGPQLDLDITRTDCGEGSPVFSLRELHNIDSTPSDWTEDLPDESHMSHRNHRETDEWERMGSPCLHDMSWRSDDLFNKVFVPLHLDTHENESQMGDQNGTGSWERMGAPFLRDISRRSDDLFTKVFSTLHQQNMSPEKHATPSHVVAPSVEAAVDKSESIGDSTRRLSTAGHVEDGSVGTEDNYSNMSPPPNLVDSVKSCFITNDAKAEHKAKRVRFSDDLGLPLTIAYGEDSRGSSRNSSLSSDQEMLDWNDFDNYIMTYDSDDEDEVKNYNEERNRRKDSYIMKKETWPRLSDLAGYGAACRCRHVVEGQKINCKRSKVTTKKEICPTNFIIPTRDEIRYKLKNNNVALSSIRLNDRSLYGEIQVVNTHFEKKVFVRHSTDEWQTACDTEAFYLLNHGYEEVMHTAHREFGCDTDTFSFDLDLQPGTDTFHFAICYKVSGEEFWDNNAEENYKLTMEDTL